MTKLAIDWEADTAIEESVLRSIGNSRLKPIFRGVAEIQHCFVSFARVCSGQHVHNAWQRYWQHIAGTTWHPTGPNALRFATTSCVARALLAGPWFLVFELHVRHATCRWCARCKNSRRKHNLFHCRVLSCPDSAGAYAVLTVPQQHTVLLSPPP